MERANQNQPKLEVLTPEAKQNLIPIKPILPLKPKTTVLLAVLVPLEFNKYPVN